MFNGGGSVASDFPVIVVDGSKFQSDFYNPVGDVTLTNGSNMENNSTQGGSYGGFEFLGTITVSAQLFKNRASASPIAPPNKDGRSG